MSRKLQVCTQPGCPEFRPCPIEGHERKPWEGSTRGGSDAGWRKTRARILARDPICKMCHKRPSVICDHKLARGFGGTEDDDNLQGLCQRCSDQKSAREGNVASQMARNRYV